MAPERSSNDLINNTISALPEFERNRAQLYDRVFYLSLKATRLRDSGETFMFRLAEGYVLRYYLDEPYSISGLASCAFSLYEDLVACGQKDLAELIKADNNSSINLGEDNQKESKTF